MFIIALFYLVIPKNGSPWEIPKCPPVLKVETISTYSLKIFSAFEQIVTEV